jgi:alkanesulfonate monooxygenase SsuD/methylene tetrahydromethanopterin reductase-like flavin-dependent oxidoreductase (luciferase family)
MLNQVLSCSAIGNRATVREAVNQFIERTGADELMVTSQIYDPEARLRSYTLLNEAMQPVAA